MQKKRRQKNLSHPFLRFKIIKSPISHHIPNTQEKKRTKSQEAVSVEEDLFGCRIKSRCERRDSTLFKTVESKEGGGRLKGGRLRGGEKEGKIEKAK